MLKTGSCALLSATLFASSSCRKEAPGDAAAGPAPVIAPGLTRNRMSGAPHGLLASRADSPVHWQLWDPSVLELAGQSRRLVFAFIGSAQYPGCVEQLNAIDGDPGLAGRLNDEFVPVLVDTDLCRESALAAGLLSQELRLPVGFPFILVLSPEGNEVTWRPIHFTPGTDVKKAVEASIDVVARIWQESPDYVKKNSAKDHANRLERLPPPDPVPADPAERDEFLSLAARQLVSLYDSDIKTMSGAGGLLPVGILQCLASAALDPEMNPEVARRCREAVAAFSATILNSAMIDPLDGGIYTSRRGKSWNLPMTLRTCMTQARSARAFVSLYSATEDPRTLAVALDAVRFAERHFGAQDGLFANQRQPAVIPPSTGLWTKEQIEEALAPKEAALWIARCGIDDLGNLSDAGGEFFRLNSLGFRASLEETAAGAGISPEEAAAILESGRAKLEKALQARTEQAPPCEIASAAPSFRMISAYAALYTVTNDVAWRDKAIALAGRCRETFERGNLLVEQSPPVAANICDARAFTYALAVQAALDLAEVTLDERWRLWAGDLVTSMAENFVTPDGRLVEARPASTPLQLPVEDRVMLFDDSTAGLMRMNLARLDALGQPPPPEIAPWMVSLPRINNFPVVFTDSILATSFKRSRILVTIPEDASPVWHEVATRLPLDRIARRYGSSRDVTARLPDGSTTVVKDPAELAAILAPPAP